MPIDNLVEIDFHLSENSILYVCMLSCLLSACFPVCLSFYVCACIVSACACVLFLIG